MIMLKDFINKKEPSGPLIDGHDGLDDLDHQVEFLDG